MENNRYRQAQPEKMSKMQFYYDEVKAIFCDEINLVSYLVFSLPWNQQKLINLQVWSMKLAKISYRLQDLAEGARKHAFMGVISFVASGRLNFIMRNISLKSI